MAVLGADVSATAGNERSGDASLGSFASLTGSKLGRLPDIDGEPISLCIASILGRPDSIDCLSFCCSSAMRL